MQCDGKNSLQKHYPIQTNWIPDADCLNDTGNLFLMVFEKNNNKVASNRVIVFQVNKRKKATFAVAFLFVINHTATVT